MIPFPAFLYGGISNPLSHLPPLPPFSTFHLVYVLSSHVQLCFATCPNDRLHSTGLGLQSCLEVASKCLQMKGHILASHPSLLNPSTSTLHANNNHTDQNAHRQHLVWGCDSKTHKFQEETNKTST